MAVVKICVCVCWRYSDSKKTIDTFTAPLTEEVSGYRVWVLEELGLQIIDIEAMKFVVVLILCENNRAIDCSSIEFIQSRA